MSKRTFTLIFTLFTVAFVLTMIALYKPSSYDLPPPIIPIPTNKPESFAQTELKFGTLSNLPILTSSSSAKTAYLLPITITTNKNKITAVQLEMSYDPDVLTNIVATPGKFFEKPATFLNHVNEETGRISFAIGVSPGDSGMEGDGIVAILTFQTKSPLRRETNISFLPKTLVTAEGINQSVLKGLDSIHITIGDNISSTIPIDKNIDN